MGNSTRMTKMLIHFNLALHRVGQGQGGGGRVGGRLGLVEYQNTRNRPSNISKVTVQLV